MHHPSNGGDISPGPAVPKGARSDNPTLLARFDTGCFRHAQALVELLLSPQCDSVLLVCRGGNRRCMAEAPSKDAIELEEWQCGAIQKGRPGRRMGKALTPRCICDFRDLRSGLDGDSCLSG